MAKIVKGNSFRNCVNYVTRASKDNSDGTPSDEWKLIACSDILSCADREEIISTFEDNRSMRPEIKKPVGHYSLDFHANDKDKISDRLMVEIAGKYMAAMGIKDTPYIIVRHFDKEHPHCHIVFSRVDDHAEIISDRNDFARNRKVCMDLTKEYGLHIAEDKSHTNTRRLKGTEKIRYEIFNAVNAAWHDSGIHTFEQLEASLKASGVELEYKYRRGTEEIQGLSFICKGKRFPASKIDRRFSFSNLKAHLARNKPLYPQSRWMYADGTIVPFYKYAGVKLSSSQVRDYVAGNTIRVDGCQGEHPTVFIRFNPQTLKAETFSSNPDTPKQTHESSDFGLYGGASHAPADEGPCTVGGGDTETWPEFRRRHPEMSPTQALAAFRAKKRGQNLNGGFSMGGLH